MEWVVSWWDGINKYHTVLLDKEAAQMTQRRIKAYSAALPRVSLEPVLITARDVFEQTTHKGTPTKARTWAGRW